MARPDWVEIGVIGAPHGLDGTVRFFPHNPDSPLLVELSGRTLRLRLESTQSDVVVERLRPASRHHLLRLRGIAGRDGAGELRHARLDIESSAFPEAEVEGEFHVFDLEGLDAVSADGSVVGKVRTVADFGAGPILVIQTPRGEMLLPFAEPFVGEVNPKEGRVVVDPSEWPEG